MTTYRYYPRVHAPYGSIYPHRNYNPSLRYQRYPDLSKDFLEPKEKRVWRSRTMLSYEHLNWNRTPFSYPNMVRIDTVADGSCFFHAIANAYFIPYWENALNGQPMSKHRFITAMRNDLATRLGEQVSFNTNSNHPITHYDLLSRGQLCEFAKAVPRYSLENMQKELRSHSAVDNVYNEFISNQLNKDIYLLDATKRDVFVTGDDDDILYKNRESIVVLYHPGHYELVGIEDPIGISFADTNRIPSHSEKDPICHGTPGSRDHIATLFAPQHPFIRAIRQRMKEIRRQK